MAILGNNTGTTLLQSFPPDVFVLQSYVMPEDGTVTSMSVYALDTGIVVARVKLGIYSNTVGNTPGNLLGETDIREIIVTGGELINPALVTLNLTSPLFLTAGTYWLVVQGDGDTYIGTDLVWGLHTDGTNKTLWAYDPSIID